MPFAGSMIQPYIASDMQTAWRANFAAVVVKMGLKVRTQMRPYNAYDKAIALTSSLTSETTLQYLSVSAQDEDESDRFLQARLGERCICHCSTSG